MNMAAEQKIELALSGLREKATKEFEGTLRRLARNEYGHPSIITHAMIDTAMRAARDNSLALIENAVIEVSSVAKTMDAFSLLKRATVNHLSELSRLVVQWRGLPLNPQQLALVRELTSDIRDDLLLNADAYQNRFKNRGGRPLEWPWDQAKAYVKSLHPLGFKPYHGLKTEVAQAMGNWFMQNCGGSPEKTQLNERAKEVVEEHTH